MEIPKFDLKAFTNNMRYFKYDMRYFKPGHKSTVFKGTHPDLRTEVAVKVWVQPHDDNEVKLLTKSMGHKNIIQILGIVTNEESKCLGYFMPYMDRGSLKEVIYNTYKNYDDIYTSEQVTSWITQVCEGLSYLHSKNIIHRDIKPGSVLLGESYDDVKLSDFGVAESLENVAPYLTKEGEILIYMAPEVLNEEIFNLSVDIYSLSITIWEILYRRYPFDHVITKPYILSRKIINGDRPELGSDLSKEIADLLKSCWHRDPSQRPKANDVLEFSKNTGFQVPEKQTILLLGGFDGSRPLDSLIVLQNHGVDEENWKRINLTLPYHVQLHGAQFLKNDLYIFGGQSANKQTLNSTYKLSNKLEWEKMADMNQGRKGISNSNVVLNDQIWVLGGRDEEIPLKSVEMYDPSANEWKYMKEMNECRSGTAATLVKGKIFCCGGWDGEKSLNSTECYDPSSDVWTLTSPLPLPLYELGASSKAENLIVIGGCSDTGDSRRVWVLDTLDENVKWVEKPRILLECSRFSIAKINYKIFVCGGMSKEDTIADVETVDGTTWRDGPKLPTCLSDSAAVAIPKHFIEYLK